MKLLFTTSIYPLSKIITDILEEPVSHCAIHFEESNLVMHMTFGGLHRVKYSDFVKKNHIHFQLEYKLDDNYEAYTEYSLYKKYCSEHYDYLAFLGIGLKAILSKIGIKTPKINLLNLTGAMVCTEFLSAAIGEEEKSMLTPYKLFLKLSEEGK